MKFEPRSFLYLDTDGIESLYAQIVDRTEREVKQKIESGTAGTAKGGFSIGRALGAVLGLGGVNAEASVSKDRKKSEEVTAVLTVEQKLARFLEHLEASSPDDAHSSIERAAARCDRSGRSCFVCCHDQFDMPQFFNGDTGLRSVNRSGYVEFEIGRHPNGESTPGSYNHSDKYYKTASRPRVIMSASVAKFPRSQGKLVRLGHDAIVFIANKGLKVPLYVFAEMSKVADFYQLKPFAIWR